MTRRCIQFVFSLWLGAIAVLSAGSARDAHALAPLDYIGPDSVKVAPPVPAPGQSATLTITDSTGVAAQVDEQSFAVRPGNILELRAKIALGYAEVIGSYTLVQDLGALEAGTYTVQYIAEARRIDQQYTGETKSWSWQLVVVDPMAKRNAIEYYNLTRNHYFVTSLQLEIDMLDSGQFSGWDRTGQSIQVVSPTASAAGFADVCRFYGLPEAGLDTHFYSAYRSECDSLIATGAGAWVLESDDAFRIFPVDLATGACPLGLLPAHRAWNGLAAVNHRYTTSAATLAEMVAKGWIAEGTGPNVAVWCALPPGN